MVSRELVERFEKLGLKVPRVLLPREGIDLTQWSVIACDQFTSEPDYWKRVESRVGESASSLKLILPEHLLRSDDVDRRVMTIFKTMHQYLETGVLRELKEGFVLVERQTPNGATRTGLIAAIDLERYDFHPGSRSIIRATEGTIASRIPPRTQIRRGASLEFPHVLVLYDDPENLVLGGVLAHKQRLTRLYDFDLMEASGHLTGYHIADDFEMRGILEGFERLADPASFERHYHSRDLLLFAIGDGNHSLAAAKTVWEEMKGEKASRAVDRPGRYALVELLNIHDPGLRFEPIHRVLFGAAQRLMDRLSAGKTTRVKRMESVEDMLSAVGEQSQQQLFGVVTEGGCHIVEFTSPSSYVVAGSLQDILDELLGAHSDISVDYVHGESSGVRLGRRAGNAGLFLPRLCKSQFFATIVQDGCFPHKTFSMGEAEEKRFYLEGRRIVE